MGFNVNRALRVLLLTNGLIILAGAMLGPIYALFVEEVGGNLLDAALAGGVFAFSAGVTTLLSGHYSDRVKESELIIVVGYLMVATGFFLYLVVGSILSLLIVQIVIGIGEAIYAAPFDAVYTKHIRAGRAGISWGLWEAMYYFVTAVGAVLGGLLVTKYGFNVLFVVMGLMSLFGALYILVLPRKLL